MALRKLLLQRNTAIPFLATIVSNTKNSGGTYIWPRFFAIASIPSENADAAKPQANSMPAFDFQFWMTSVTFFIAISSHPAPFTHASEAVSCWDEWNAGSAVFARVRGALL